MKTIIIIAGIYNVAFALFHLGFWKMFKWKKDLKQLSFANRGILQILNVQMIYFFVLVAFMCFVFPQELLSTTIGKVFLAGNALFWIIRTIQQFIFFKANHLLIHLLTLVFILGAILFIIPVVIE